jgi:hypothetical protein
MDKILYVNKENRLKSNFKILKDVYIGDLLMTDYLCFSKTGTLSKGAT